MWERRAARRGYGAVAGCDEAGRGALAGPVVAAAVILDPKKCPKGIRDSKTLTALARERLYGEIVVRARAWGVGIADAEEVDRYNVLEATRRAMIRAVEALAMQPDYLIVDAVSLRGLAMIVESPVKADRDVMSVAAASIMAKVTRDRILVDLDATYAVYGFAEHKGYGTRPHFEAIARHGLSPVHRRSFAGIACGTLFAPEELSSLVSPRRGAPGRRAKARPPVPDVP